MAKSKKEVSREARQVVKKALTSFDQQIGDLFQAHQAKQLEIERIECYISKLLPGASSRTPSKSVPSSPIHITPTLTVSSPLSAPISLPAISMSPLGHSVSCNQSPSKDMLMGTSPSLVSHSPPLFEVKQQQRQSQSSQSQDVIGPHFPSLSQALDQLERLADDKDSVSLFFRELCTEYLTAIGSLQTELDAQNAQVRTLQAKLQGLRLRMRNLSSLCHAGLSIPEYSRHINSLAANSPAAAQKAAGRGSSAAPESNGRDAR